MNKKKTRARHNVYVKAPLRVMYEKYSTRGGVEWQIQHEAKPSAVFATRPHPECCIFRTSRVNGALTNLLFFRGRISTRISKMDSQRNAVDQVKEIVSPSLLP